MRELSIENPFTLSEVEEIKAEIIPKLEQKRSFLDKQFLLNKVLFSIITTLIVICIIFPIEKISELLPIKVNYLLFISFMAFSCVVWILLIFHFLYLDAEKKCISSNFDAIYNNNERDFMTIAIKEQDKPLALFLQDITDQRRNITHKEVNFLEDYIEQLIKTKKEIQLNHNFKKLLS